MIKSLFMTKNKGFDKQEKPANLSSYTPEVKCTFNMAELESSLTAMDWLPRLSVGGAMAGNSSSKTDSTTTKVAGGHIAMRKGPNSPLDTSATFDEDSQTCQQKDGKPPYSYANLITFAINSSPKKKMTLSDIYQWICDNFPYYKDAGNGWKVSCYP